MATTVETPTGPPGERSPLEAELERVGLARRILMARRWYGADWWFVAVASVMVTAFSLLAVAPGAVAPHDPRAQAGPRNLAPGEATRSEVFISSTTDEISGLADLATGDRASFGVVVGTPSSVAARDEADRVSDELQAAGGEEAIRLRIVRFDSLTEMLDALAAGEVVAAGASAADVEPVLGDYPDLVVDGSLDGEEAAGQSFVLGTNALGQDVLSRLIWGTRISFQIGMGAALFALIIGAPIGLISGYVGGWFDRVLSVVMDSLYAFPGLILAIAISAVLGPSVANTIFAIAVLYIPTYFRIVRGQTLSIKEQLFIEAARSVGASNRSILTKYIYPSVVPSVAIIFSVNVADGILTGAGLSFLGLGLPPDVPDWGIDLARGQESIQTAWWLITFPGLAVMLVVLAFTMLGEGLVEIFNPRLRDR